MDVIIPVHKKDLKVVSFAIRAFKFFSLNQVRNIYVIGNIELKSRLPKNVIFVNELELGLPLKEGLNYIDSNGLNRNGWLFQQFIKLSADQISDNEYIMILDADTIFLRPVLWINGIGKSLLLYSDEYHLPYEDFLRLVFPSWRRYPSSFVCHQLLIKRDSLIDLKAQIELKFNKPLYNVILENCDFNEMSCFSEYELLGNYLVHNKIGGVIIKHWKNITVPFTSSMNFFASFFLYGLSYRSMSFHDYKK